MGAQIGNWWNQVRSGDAYTIGQTTAAVASLFVNPEDISAAASKASKVDSLLGKVSTFSKSMVISSAENARSIITSPWRMVDNLGSKVEDLSTVLSKGKGLVGDFTKSVVVSSAKKAENLVTLSGRALTDIKGAAIFVDERLIPASAKAVKDFGKVLQDTGEGFGKVLQNKVENAVENLKRLIPQREFAYAGVAEASTETSGEVNTTFSKVVKDLKSGVGEVKDNFVKAIKSGDGVAAKAEAEAEVKLLYPRGDKLQYDIFIKQDKIALDTYTKLRETGLDANELKTFSENTGLSIDVATRIKEHIFLTEHKNLLNYETKTYFSDYFQPDIHIAYGWEKALKGELSDSQKAWFRQLAKHELEESELMKKGEPYRTIEGIDENGMPTSNPPGAHDKASTQPGDFPDFEPQF